MLDKSEVNVTSWNPQQYRQFSDHRLRPALELLDRLPAENPRLVYDLGCGAGEITAILAEKWTSANVIGIDHSDEMLDHARTMKSSISWQRVDINRWRPEDKPDVIFSNAALQWVDGHDHLFPKMISHLSEGGFFAAQMPLSWSAPSHRLMRETLEEHNLGNRDLRDSMGRRWVEDANFYYDLLSKTAMEIDIWETEYLQILTGDDPVLEWVKGTGLRPVLHGLSDKDRETFLNAYRQRLRSAYPGREDGRTLYPFRRLFIVVQT
ncbi:MAG: methyltransferase domain-containing protein [Candidatus Latescibacteria bacterium]|jgi:trans-aconitate 2-methyltransferase|nr:methyltransferase domain-containing protein [Candidatus Latescibacterota bacterium]